MELQARTAWRACFTSRIYPPPAVARYCKRKGFFRANNSVTTENKKKWKQADRKSDGQNYSRQKTHFWESYEKTDDLIWPDRIGSPRVLDQFGLKGRNPLWRPDTYWYYLCLELASFNDNNINIITININIKLNYRINY